MRKTSKAFLLFFLACLVHAALFLYFFTTFITEALDGSRVKSWTDWLPLALFLSSFSIHLLPVLRNVWKTSFLRSMLALVALTALLVWILSSIARF